MSRQVFRGYYYMPWWYRAPRSNWLVTVDLAPSTRAVADAIFDDEELEASGVQSRRLPIQIQVDAASPIREHRVRRSRFSSGAYTRPMGVMTRQVAFSTRRHCPTYPPSLLPLVTLNIWRQAQAQAAQRGQAVNLNLLSSSLGQVTIS